jgi:hypothetical protein
MRLSPIIALFESVAYKPMAVVVFIWMWQQLFSHVSSGLSLPLDVVQFNVASVGSVDDEN